MTSPLTNPRWFIPLLSITWLLAFVLGKKGEPSPTQLSPSSAESTKFLQPQPTSLPSQLPETAVGRTLATLAQIESLQTREDFQTTLAELIKFSDKTEKERHLALLFKHWLEVNPQEALQEVRKVEMLRAHGQRIALAFQTWANQNPLESSQLLQETFSFQNSDQTTLPFRDLIDPPNFILSLFSGLTHADPNLAATLLSSVPESAIRAQSLNTLAQIWFAQNPEQALAWASRLPSNKPVLRQQALSEVADRAGLSDNPELGIQWADQLTTPADRTLALKNISTQWSQKNARSAYQWASTLPDTDPSKFKLMPSVIRRLTLTDPGLAADWLNQYDAAPRMDASIAAYAQTIQFINPQAARGSAQAITDPQLRADIESQLNANE